MRMLAAVFSEAIVLFARFITAVRGIWQGIEPADTQRIYYANHSSHGDFILIWTVFSHRMRKRTRPVAGGDYWNRSAARRFVGRDVFNAVLIEREAEHRTADPVDQMVEAVDAGYSLIVFPEGTRNGTDAPLLPFKSGLFHLARKRPDIDLVPVWIANLNRVMPKGEVVPIPLVCTVTFGAPLRLGAEERKEAFLERARNALLDLGKKELQA